jgi:hypothetical protein
MSIAKLKYFDGRLGMQIGVESRNKGKLCTNHKEPKPRLIYKITGYNKKTHNYLCINVDTKAKCFIFAEDAFFRDDNGELLNK